MKKAFALLLCVSLLAAFAACGKEETTAEPDTVVLATQETAAIKYPDKAVRVTIPLVYIDDDYRDNLEGFTDSRGFYSMEKNETAGTVTFEMSALAHHLLLTEIGMDTISAVYHLQESGEYPWFKSIQSLDRDSFKSVTITVDRALYEADHDLTFVPFLLASNCMKYQAYTTKNRYKCQVTLLDDATGEEIFKETYTEHN